MTHPANQEELLTKQVHNLRNELEHLASTCKTTDELRAVVSVIAQANTYLSRTLAVAISSFAHGGAQPRPGEAYSVTLQAETDLETIKALEGMQLREGMSLHLQHMLRLLSAASHASAYAYGAVMKADNVSMEALREGAAE